MNEEPAGADTPAAEGVQPDAIVVHPEPTPEQPATENVEPVQEEPAIGDDEAAAPRKKPGVHNRIDELTRQKHEALREAAYWREKAEAAARTDFDTLDYDDQIIAKLRLTERQERAEAAEVNATNAVERQFAELETAARAKWTDYDVVTRNANLPITPAMAQIIKDSEYGPDLAYHLGKNPGEAIRLSALSGLALAREVGRIEATITAPKPVATPPAAPVKPVAGMASGGAKDPAKMSMAEYVAWRKSQED